MDYTFDRSKGIGASEIACIVGLNPFKSAYELYREKKYGIKDFQGNDNTLAGSILEKFVIEYYSKTKDFIVAPGEQFTVSNQYIFATPDGYVTYNGERYVLEVKTTTKSNYSEGWSNQVYQGIPAYYYCQVQTQLHLTGYKKALVLAYIKDEPNIEIRERIVEYDETFAENLIQKATEWYETYILSDEVHPTPEEEVEDNKVLVVNKQDELYELLKLYHEQKMEAEAREATANMIKQDIIALVGDNSGVLCEGKKLVTRYTSYNNSLKDSAGLKLSNPELFKTTKYTVVKINKL